VGKRILSLYIGCVLYLPRGRERKRERKRVLCTTNRTEWEDDLRQAEEWFHAEDGFVVDKSGKEISFVTGGHLHSCGSCAAPQHGDHHPFTIMFLGKNWLSNFFEASSVNF
jgi:hypothetical protein